MKLDIYDKASIAVLVAGMLAIVLCFVGACLHTEKCVLCKRDARNTIAVQGREISFHVCHDCMEAIVVEKLKNEKKSEDNQ